MLLLYFVGCLNAVATQMQWVIKLLSSFIRCKKKKIHGFHHDIRES